MKKCLSIILMFAFCLNFILVPNTALAFAMSGTTKNIKIIKATDNQIVYTYEQNGETYKIVDLISLDQKSVNSKIYLLKDGKYVLEDTIDYHIKSDTMIIHSHKRSWSYKIYSYGSSIF